MTSTATVILEQLDGLLEELCASPEMDAGFDTMRGSDLVSAMVVGGSVRRRLDAVLTALTGQVSDRDTRLADERVSPAAGCRDVTELLRRALRVDAGTARRLVHASRATHREMILSRGEPAPAAYPAMAAALRDGVVSVPGLLAAIGPVERSGNRVGADVREAVDGLLAATARGEDLPDEHGRPGPAPSTDELADFARALMLRLDPDGAEPDDRDAERNRGITFGRLRGGIVPFHGGLLPQTAAQMQLLFDAVGNPAAADAPPVHAGGVAFTTDEDGNPLPNPAAPDSLPDPVDARTPAQRRHDALAMIVNVAAASGGFPELGGAAPTLVVSVTAEDYANGTGRVHLEGTPWDAPVDAARQTACAGGASGCCSTSTGRSSRSAPPPASSPRSSGARSCSATGNASFPAVTRLRPGASCTTCRSGPRVAPRTRATGSRCAGITTAL